MPAGENQPTQPISTENQQDQPQETQEQIETQEPTQEPSNPTEPPQNTEQAQEIIEQKGFDYQALEQEYFDNNGELTKETKEKLNKQGFSDEFINDFINGKKAIYEQEVNDLAQSVGGRESYDSLIEWSAKNLDSNLIQAVNSVRDKNILKEFILPKLKEKMEEKEGKLPDVALKGGSNPKSLDVFESQEQMFEAVRNPRYLNDPAYQEKVTAKIRASREAGIDLGI